jgi:AraC-like DNA-binding protein
MDVLSDVVATMRTGRPHSNRNPKHGRWGATFEPFAGAGFHVVLQGSCWLIPPSGEPVALGVGDVVCALPHTRGYGLADSPSTPLDGTGSLDAALPRTSGHGLADSPLDATENEDGPADTVLLCGAYVLDQSRPHPLLAELPELIHFPARVGRHPELRSAVDLLGAELERPRPGADAIVPALLDMLLLYLLRAWYDEQAGHHTASGWAAALLDPAVSAALHALHHDPARPWTVETLGAEAGLSRAAFARRFSALVGQPPLAYLTWWRMTTAARLLRETDSPLSTVAKQTGYTSEFAFARAFKREYGTAPGGYRRAFC